MPLGRTAGAGHSCHHFRLHDRRASSTFSGPVRRSWVAGIVSFHSHRNLQDSNLRPLPLSVKRRIPPRPRFRMPPSFRGVSSLAFGAHCLMPVKGDVAAWRARPSAQFIGWFSAVRHISHTAGAAAPNRRPIRVKEEWGKEELRAQRIHPHAPIVA